MQKIISFFYDSYSGWKKPRVVVGISILLLLVVMPISLCGINANKDTPESSDPGMSNSDSTEGSNFISPSQTPAYTEDIGGEIINTEISGESFDEYSERAPAIGDIVAGGGIPDDVEPAATAEPTGNEFSSWTNEAELQAIAKGYAEKVRDNCLLYLDTELERGNWESFAKDSALLLSDALALGVEIRYGLDNKIVSSWNATESAYTQLYTEFYAAESSEDMRIIAASAARKEAIELTDSFLKAITN